MSTPGAVRRRAQQRAGVAASSWARYGLRPLTIWRLRANRSRRSDPRVPGWCCRRVPTAVHCHTISGWRPRPPVGPAPVNPAVP